MKFDDSSIYIYTLLYATAPCVDMPPYNWSNLGSYRSDFFRWVSLLDSPRTRSKRRILLPRFREVTFILLVVYCRPCLPPRLSCWLSTFRPPSRSSRRTKSIAPRQPQTVTQQAAGSCTSYILGCLNSYLTKTHQSRQTLEISVAAYRDITACRR